MRYFDLLRRVILVAESEIPSAEIPQPSKVPSLKLGVGQNGTLHAFSADSMYVFLPVSSS